MYININTFYKIIKLEVICLVYKCEQKDDGCV